jgi:hypothetical protein
MHFAFVPVVTDKRKGIQKVCAKELLTRAEFQKFHGDLDTYLTSVFGRSTGVLNGATKEGNRSIGELKRGTAVKELRRLREETKIEEQRIDDLKCGDSIQPIKEKKDSVVISKADYETASNALAKNKLYDRRVRESDARIAAVNSAQQKKYFALWKEYDKLKARQAALETERDALNNRLRRIDRAFADKPGFLESFLQLAERTEQVEAEAERAAQAAKRKQKQAEKGEMEIG